MAKNDQQESYEKVLTSLLLRIHDNQKFAETKNAALLTFCSAWILAAIAQSIHNTRLPEEYEKAIAWALPWFVGGAAVALTSLLPRMNLPKMSEGRSIRNLLFFGHISAMAPAAFAADIRKSYFPVEGDAATAEYLTALEAQIHANAKITSRKHRLFFCGATTTMVGVFILAMPQFLRLAKMIGELSKQIA